MFIKNAIFLYLRKVKFKFRKVGKKKNLYYTKNLKDELFHQRSIFYFTLNFQIEILVDYLIKNFIIRCHYSM